MLDQVIFPSFCSNLLNLLIFLALTFKYLDSLTFSINSLHSSIEVVKWCLICINGIGFDVMHYLINECWVCRDITAFKGGHFAYVSVSQEDNIIGTGIDDGSQEICW